MLPSTLDDNSRYGVYAYLGQGFHVMLIRNNPMPTERPHTLLWDFECGDEFSFNAAYRWFMVRRALWQSWGQLIEENRPVFFEQMHQLMAEEPIGLVEATLIQSDPDRKHLNLGDILATPNGPRYEVLYRHKFSTPGKRKRFLEWVAKNCHGPQQLVDMAVERGTAAVANLLECIAAGKNPELPPLEMA